MVRTLILGLLAATSLAGCLANVEEKLGIVGEFCRVDDDCATNLVCDNSVCRSNADTGPLSCDPNQEPAGTITCEQMCDRLTNECQRTEDNCVGTCKETVRCWSAEAVDVFGQCTLGMTEPVLTCEQARSNEAPSICYRQIPLPQDRKARCDKFVQQANSIATNATQDALDTLRGECYRLARTGTESTWALSEDCDNAIQPDLSTVEIVECFNQLFSLNPKLEAAEMTMPDPDPGPGPDPDVLPVGLQF